MQGQVDRWLVKYYPRINRQAFAGLLREAAERRLSSEEFRYVVLGCGYLFHVHYPTVENQLDRLKHQLLTNPEDAALIFDEKRIRNKLRDRGPVIGPEEQPLSAQRKRGPVPKPAPKIAALVISRWVSQHRPDLDPVPWACDLYTALTGRSMKPATFKRFRRAADAETIESLGTEDQMIKVAVTDHLLSLFENRYRRFQQEGFPDTSADNSPAKLYLIGGILRPVLKAVAIYLDPPQNPIIAMKEVFRNRP